MSQPDFYKDFDEAQQKRYEEQARQRWGAKNVNESARRWNACTPQEKNAILAEGNAITLGIANNMENGYDSPEVQHWIGRWHQSINQHFYPCSLEIFEALGHGYVQEPEFTAFYEKVRPGLAMFMEQAMVYYCKKERQHA